MSEDFFWSAFQRNSDVTLKSFLVQDKIRMCEKEGYELFSIKPKIMVSIQIPIYQRQARRTIVEEGTVN